MHKEPSAVPWNTLARRASKRIAQLKGTAPPCTIAALFRSWLNGWCTARRFQEKGMCRLSSTCIGEDSLEHYARCKFSWEWLGMHARFDTEHRSLARFLVLDLQSGDCPTLLAVNLYAIYSTVNHFRSLERRGRQNEALTLIRERWRFVETLAPQLASLRAKRWIA